MSLPQFNARHSIEMTFYNEGESTRDDGGLVLRNKGEEVNIRVLYIHTENTREIRKENGQRYRIDGFTFQVSKRDLDSNSFSIEAGKTFVIKDGYVYKVLSVQDYSMFPLTRSYECKAIRMVKINAD